MINFNIFRFLKKRQNITFFSRPPQRLSAFSLMELSIVLVVIGVLMGAIFKGRELLDIAKIQSIVSDIQNIKIAFHTYQDTYNALPGDDAKATERFGVETPNGNGDGIIDENESINVFKHLYKANDWQTETAPSSKLGGTYRILYQSEEGMKGHWILLSGDNNAGVLTPKQAQSLMTKIDAKGVSDNPNVGLVRVKNGNGASDCVVNDKLNLQSSVPSCIVFFNLS